MQPNGEHIVGRTIDATSEYHCIHIALSSSFVVRIVVIANVRVVVNIVHVG